jgi:hypothetical protein
VSAAAASARHCLDGATGGECFASNRDFHSPAGSDVDSTAGVDTVLVEEFVKKITNSAIRGRNQLFEGIPG